MNNRFDTVRLAAALAVFGAHGVVLYQLTVLEPFRGHSLGALAVGVFFFVSGYLVCQSWMCSPSWQVFLAQAHAAHFPRAASRRHADRLPARPLVDNLAATRLLARPSDLVALGKQRLRHGHAANFAGGVRAQPFCEGREWFTVDYPLRVGDVHAIGLRSLARPWGALGFSGPGGSHGIAVAERHHLALGCSFAGTTPGQSLGCAAPTRCWGFRCAVLHWQ